MTVTTIIFPCSAAYFPFSMRQQLRLPVSILKKLDNLAYLTLVLDARKIQLHDDTSSFMGDIMKREKPNADSLRLVKLELFGTGNKLYLE